MTFSSQTTFYRLLRLTINTLYIKFKQTYYEVNFTNLFLASFFNFNYAQCNASAMVSNGLSPGIIDITDFSTTSSGAIATTSYIEFFDSAYIFPLGVVYLQPNNNAATFFVNANGTYNYLVTVIDSITTCMDTDSGTIVITNYLPNQATCDAAFNSVEDSTNIYLYSFNSAGVNNSATAEYSWDFGDGATSALANPTHLFGGDSTYYVCLTVSDTAYGGCTDTECNYAVVGAVNPCTASVSLFPTQSNGLLVDIIELNSTPNPIATFSTIEFFDSSLTNSIGFVNLVPFATNSFTFPNPGVYGYIYIVEDTIANCSDTIVGQFTASNSTTNTASCDANFYQSIDSTDYHTYYFYAMGSGNSPTITYSWSFGDGDSSVLASPTHTYTADGPYPVNLIVTDTANGGCSDSFTYMVQVNPNVSSPTSCAANFLLFEDSAFAGQFFAWNFSTGTNITYLWDFGDGNTSSLAFPSHTYASTGSYAICLTINADSNCTDMFCDTLVAVVKSNGTTIQVLATGQSVGIENASVFNSITVFPNPFNEQLSLSIEATKKQDIAIEIVSINGVRVFQERLELVAGSNTIKLDQLNVSKGMYLLNIIDMKTNERTIKKIIHK